MELLKSACCVCGCEVILKDVCLTEDTWEPICNSCFDYIPEEDIYPKDEQSEMWNKFVLRQ